MKSDTKRKKPELAFVRCQEVKHKISRGKRKQLSCYPECKLYQLCDKKLQRKGNITVRKGAYRSGVQEDEI